MQSPTFSHRPSGPSIPHCSVSSPWALSPCGDSSQTPSSLYNVFFAQLPPARPIPEPNGPRVREGWRPEGILEIYGAKAGGFTGSTGVQSWPCPPPPHGFSSWCPSGPGCNQQTLSQTPTLLSRTHRLRSHPNLNSHPRLSFRGPLRRWYPSRLLKPCTVHVSWSLRRAPGPSS